jgi:hypothetical protein
MSRPSIDPNRDREKILDHSTRRKIARACRRRPQSVSELEKALGSKGLHATVRKLEEWGVLIPVGATVRGSDTFALAPEWSAQLDAAISRNASALVADQRLVILGHRNLAAAARCLAAAHADEMAWVGVLGEREGLVIGIEQLPAGSSISAMKQTLRQAGVDCELTEIGDPTTGAEVGPFLRGLGAGGPGSSS